MRERATRWEGGRAGRPATQGRAHIFLSASSAAVRTCKSGSFRASVRSERAAAAGGPILAQRLDGSGADVAPPISLHCPDQAGSSSSDRSGRSGRVPAPRMRRHVRVVIPLEGPDQRWDGRRRIRAEPGQCVDCLSADALARISLEHVEEGRHGDRGRRSDLADGRCGRPPNRFGAILKRLPYRRQRSLGLLSQVGQEGKHCLADDRILVVDRRDQCGDHGRLALAISVNVRAACQRTGCSGRVPACRSAASAARMAFGPIS